MPGWSTCFCSSLSTRTTLVCGCLFANPCANLIPGPEQNSDTCVSLLLGMFLFRRSNASCSVILCAPCINSSNSIPVLIFGNSSFSSRRDSGGRLRYTGSSLYVGVFSCHPPRMNSTVFSNRFCNSIVVKTSTSCL